MKPTKTLVMALVSAMVLLSSCAKEDSEFAAKYAKNGMGGSAQDGAAAQRAGEFAEENGLQADIIRVTRSGGNGNTILRATILINNRQKDVESQHSGTEVVEGTTEIDGFEIRYHAVCPNKACEPAYAGMEVYQYFKNHNNKMMQVGVKKYFDQNTGDAYQWFQPAEALPFMGSSFTDASGLVGFLSKKTSSSADVK
ncbi:hypothetical protein D3C72_958130 [compost metagenome]